MKLWKRQTKGDITFRIINYTLMILLCIGLIYPLWYVLIISFNTGSDTMKGGIYLWPRAFTLFNYTTVLRDAGVIRAFFITAARTVLGVISSVFFTAMVAYGLSKRQLMGRKVYMMIGVITLMFGGGLIPYFLLLRNLHLIDSFLVYIIPFLFGFYNCLIFISFFESLPTSLEESAMIDGANDFVIFLRVILPLSKPVLATIALFNGVFHWNDYFSGVIYINDPKLLTIQTFLYRIVAEAGNEKLKMMMPSGMTRATSPESLKLATMIITTLPIVMVYPFLQKYFVKGVMIGAVKG